MTRRLDDWPTRLNAFIDAARERPFAWGTWDCCTFAAAAVETVTGIALSVPRRGDYADEEGAMAALAALGCADVAALAALVLGGDVAPALAQRGDIVLIDVRPLQPALGVCLGHLVAAVGPSGLAFLPLSAVLRAWRV